MKLKLRHQDYCDGCEELNDIGTLGGHKRCKIFGFTMLPQHDTFQGSKGLGWIKRPQKCIDENEQVRLHQVEYFKRKGK